jgi:hypothetical protein
MPTNPDALRHGVRISVVRDIETDADIIEMSLPEPHYFVRAEFHQNDYEIHEFLASVVQHQMDRSNATIDIVANVVGETPDSIVAMLNGNPTVDIERIIDAAEAIGAHFDSVMLDSPFDDWDGGEVHDE